MQVPLRFTAICSGHAPNASTVVYSHSRHDSPSEDCGEWQEVWRPHRQASKSVDCVFAYVREIAGRTEQYWRPIRHAKRVHAHVHYRRFVDYGDAEGYRRRWLELRNELKEDAEPAD